MRSVIAPRRLTRAAALVVLSTATACGSRAGESAPPPADAAAAPQQAAQAAAPAVNAAGVKMVVYKTPTCGCCRAWVDHAKAAGFDVQVVDTANVDPVKREHGVPGHLDSCHTAVVDGFVIEGHVPAADVVRLLREKPQGVAGIAVPGMPRGSPGMEVPGGARDPYDVIAFSKEGRVSVFETH
ncbi:MAG: DUF411 domain-containing protein [Gemmatimonadetes bacterium]|nr:DUF411 domain-containing protein [Gemmatimonadota bacterium]